MNRGVIVTISLLAAFAAAPAEGETEAPAPGGLTIEEAVLQALENNRALRIQRLAPAVAATFYEQERAAFDPEISADASLFQERGRDRLGQETRIEGWRGGVGITDYLPTGTTLEAGAVSEKTGIASDPEQYSTRVGISATQALLRGRGTAVNLAALRQARLDLVFSEYEFKGFAENLVAEVEEVYWRYVYALRSEEIVSQSLDLAERQLEDTRQRIRVGQLAEIELAAAEAEVALRRESLINAASRVESFRVRLLRLVAPARLDDPVREVEPLTRPLVPELPTDPLEDHLAAALAFRPDLNQADLLVRRGELEVVKTRNGLLPRMDLFITMGKTGYSDSFGGSVSDVPSDDYDLRGGLRFDYPVGSRAARARDDRAALTLEQRRESLENLRDLARQDVELALIEVRRARQQVDATATTRRFQEEKLRSETAKFRVGKSTGILVAAAQRDLLASQVAEVEAVINNLTARISLYLMEGTLLERRGLAVAVPGEE